MSDLTPELNAFAARLATLQPAPAADRDRLLFEAGRRSAPRPRGWPMTTLVIACLAGWLGLRPPTVFESVVVVERPVIVAPSYAYAPETPLSPRDNYLQQRNVALRLGVDALPHASDGNAGSNPLSARDFKSVLN